MSRLLNADEAHKFEKILAEYQPNNEVLELFRNSNFNVIDGPAGGGKDTLRNSLIKEYPDIYLPILSTTTRPPRQGEVDGQTYHFWEIEQVEQGLKQREFFQTALIHRQQISSLHVEEIKKLSNNRTGLSILIISVEAEMRAIKPDIKTVFLIPPDYQTLLERMNTERMLAKDEVARRLQGAKSEIALALDLSHVYCLVSDTVQHVTDVAHAYFQNDIRDDMEDERARLQMRTILKSLDV